jgi:hypothetical protein
VWAICVRCIRPRASPLTPTATRTPAVRAVVEDNLHSEVEHPDAWAHRNLDELDRADVAAVREMSTGAGGAANERGAPALGRPLRVGVVTGAGR